MRITPQLIRRQAKISSLQSIEYLDLSHIDIVLIEKLGQCKKIQTLDLSYNQLESVSTNLEELNQLWNLNLSNNKLRCLEGLQKFIAVGTLNLAHNHLTWTELAKIKHLHMLDLRLHGNPELEKDAYYRIHVIDCLPNVWMLDGRLVTSAERVQVKSFFDDSATTDRPIRHKLSTVKGIVPSHLQNRLVNGVFGEKTNRLLRQFPIKETLNIDLDVRRLHYLSINFLEDMLLEHTTKYRLCPLLDESTGFIEDLLNIRKTDLQKGNMLLVLIMMSLEFSVPDSLTRETLEITQLDKIGKLVTIDLFLLVREKRAMIGAILLSAVRIERVEIKTGGIYDKLYLSMNYLVAEAVKSCSGAGSPITGIYKKYKSLLAAEVVLLMCYVPSFCDYMLKEPGVMSLVSSATGDPQIVGNVIALRDQLTMQEVPERAQIEAIGQFVQSSVLHSLTNSCSNKPPVLKKEERILSKKHLPKRPMSGPIFSSGYHTKGLTSPDTKPPRILSAKPQRNRQPDIGDTVLTAPQSLARIISLPQPDIALILLELIPDIAKLKPPPLIEQLINLLNGAMRSKIKTFEEHYAYIDVKELTWDIAKSFWRPKGTVGDRLTVHFVNASAVLGQTPEHAGRSSPINIHVPAQSSPKFPRKSLIDDRQNEVFSVMAEIKENEVTCSPVQRDTPKLRTPDGKGSPSAKRSGNQTTEPVRQQKVEYQPITPSVGPNVHPPPSKSDVDVESFAGSGNTDSAITATTSQLVAQGGQLVELASYRAESITTMPTEGGTVAAASEKESADAMVTLTLKHQPIPAQTHPPAESSKQEINEMKNTNNNCNQVEEVPVGQNGDQDSTTPNQGVSRPDTALEEMYSDIMSDDGDLEISGLSIADEHEHIDLATTAELDLTRNITERNPAPMNSPDSWLPNSRAQSGHNRSRIPSARLNKLNQMLASAPHREPLPSRQWRPGSSIVLPPETPRDDRADEVSTPYLRQRTDAWNLTIEESPGIPFIPPDPSLVHSGAVNPKAAVRWANTWMGGGRDLYHEEQKRRPTSSHVPGWKEGLQGSMPIRASLRRVYERSYSSQPLPDGLTQEEVTTVRVKHPLRATHSALVRPATNAGIRSSYLSSRRNMRDRRQLLQSQRELAWANYILRIQPQRLQTPHYS